MKKTIRLVGLLVLFFGCCCVMVADAHKNGEQQLRAPNFPPTTATTTATTVATNTTIPTTTVATTTAFMSTTAACFTTVSPAFAAVGQATTFTLGMALEGPTCNTVSNTVGGMTTLSAMSSLSTFLLTPSVSGLYQVNVACANGTIVLCASFYALLPSPTITIAFTGSAPASSTDQATFEQNFAQICALAAHVDVSQIVDIAITTPSARRNSRIRAATAPTPAPTAGFSVSFAVLDFATFNSSACASAVISAAQSGTLMTRAVSSSSDSSLYQAGTGMTMKTITAGALQQESGLVVAMVIMAIMGMVLVCL